MDAQPDPRALSTAAHEVLGTLAACTCSGPHRVHPLRKLTRLTELAFDGALRELATRGLVERQAGGVFWVTTSGERQAQRLFG